ncbi:MAG: bifunctional hydroxymethylpyrimidine kinase/phosphomethylpyrimidine kinase, partial [Desulfarculus sp.]|nr:bifunctional hydroxymethylpyrimidine kinase/phosphomethylpyrimidine kinase [Desulfarculus sp.]
MAVARVMVLAGSDSGGGAGLQADLLTVAALGGHACTVVTALTAQDTQAVRGVWPVPVEFVAAQFQAVRDDIGLDAVKTGMLPSAAHVELAAVLLAPLKVPLVVDPVLRASAGQSLMEPAALEALRTRLLPLASLVTPNLAEAEALTGLAVRDPEAMARAARALVEMGAKAALVKGGHLEGQPVDLLFDGWQEWRFSAPRLACPHDHGTGCTMASAVATL